MNQGLECDVQRGEGGEMTLNDNLDFCEYSHVSQLHPVLLKVMYCSFNVK